ncbi:MAG TPA: glycosyltransferase family 2 protein [Tepidisphaeraceae bacterium]|nr:glycosyltransferase family 2 protein [Tepidisphaeraceae bacterium]
MPVEVQSLAEWEAAGMPDMLSVVIPAHNEEGHIAETVRALYSSLNTDQINHELLVINDNSSDKTEEILKQLQVEIPTLRYINNAPPNGFGFAVRCGLAEFRGDAVAIVMADLSDSPDDLVRFYHKLLEGYDCVFGSRFMRGGKVIDYPLFKLALNRLGNFFIQMLFFRGYNDTTNAFKMYRRSVIAGIQPLLAYHFNLTVELPLKAIVREYKYAVLPNSWHNRKEGVSKFKIKEMGSRYLFIILYCWLERRLSMKDYRHQNTEHLKQTQLQVWRR